MSESFDRELELVKLQIAAENCFAEVQIDVPLYLSGIIVVCVFAFSIMVQFPSTVPMAVITVAFAFVLGLLFYSHFVQARRRYQDGIRNVDVYVEDFRARRPLPSVTSMCRLKEKKVR